MPYMEVTNQISYNLYVLYIIAVQTFTNFSHSKHDQDTNLLIVKVKINIR